MKLLAILLLALPLSAQNMLMLASKAAGSGITVDSSDKFVGGLGTSNTFSYTTGSCSNPVMVVFATSQILNDSTAMEYNSVSLTVVSGAHVMGSFMRDLSAWVLVGPASGTHNLVTHNTTTDSTNGLDFYVRTYCGGNATQPDSSTSSSETPVASPPNYSTTVTVANANSWCVMATNNFITATAGNTNLLQTGNTGQLFDRGPLSTGSQSLTIANLAMGDFIESSLVCIRP